MVGLGRGTLREEVILDRLNLVRAAMREAGHDEEKIARTIDESWVWRNVSIAETEEKAIALGTPDGVREHFRRLKAAGIGGAIIRFRIGMLPHEAVLNSLRLFATEVAPAV